MSGFEWGIVVGFAIAVIPIGIIALKVYRDLRKHPLW